MKPMRARRHRRLILVPPNRRRGVTLLESAFAIMVFLILVFGALDMGLAISRYQLLSHIAHEVARQTIVHGEFSAPVGGPWGPSAYSATADAGDDIANVAKDALEKNRFAAFTSSEVTVSINWPDGDNDVGSRIQVTAAAQYSPITFVLGAIPITLQAGSEMQIAH